MKLFITGICGFLGSHLAERFVADGHDVWGNDNLLLGSEDNLPDGIRGWLNLDCCDFAKHPDLLKDIDVLYHCAATAHEGLSVFSPSFVTRNIYEASVATFSAAIAAGVKRIVFCSSMARYGNGAAHSEDGFLQHDNEHVNQGRWACCPPFREDIHVTNPVDPYGIAKVAAEDTLRALANAHGIEYVIAVPHNIVGLRQNYTDPFRNVCSIMINRMKQGKAPIIYGDGRQTRCFSPVADVLDTLAQFATAPAEVVNGQVFNVGPDDDEIPIIRLFNILSDILEYPTIPIFMPDRPLEVKHAVCSSDKIRKVFGYKRVQSLEDCLKEMCKAIQPKPFEYKLPLEIVTENTPQTWSKRLM